MSFIEHEFEETQKLRDKRMFIVIKKNGMKTLRRAFEIALIAPSLL